MNGKSRPRGGSQTLAKSRRSVRRSAEEVLADAQAQGRHVDAALLRWLMGRAG